MRILPDAEMPKEPCAEKHALIFCCQSGDMILVADSCGASAEIIWRIAAEAD
ncbi:hypothetical protein [Rhodoblastus acidophilus]|uniref:hypothetical protein n=1 Tax=Rhodoblastus acidophilus TaxID=1074 RepID=UPI0013049F17|nr:hypothetical protein [Rhodoblastus acidophilus]